MATKENMFSAAAQRREQEQQQIEAAVTGKVSVGGGKVRKRGDHATTMSLSVSLEDKIKIKEYAARRCLSVSDILHSWIEEHCVE